MRGLRALAAATVVAAGLGLFAGSALAVKAEKEPESRDWSFYGLFGSYDRAAQQRGYLVYKEVCSGCHSVKYLSFRNLLDIGFSEEEAKAVAAEFMVEDGPDEEGEMFEREARLSDPFPRPYRNDNEARSLNNGALPPDLSLMTKARHGGPDYLFALLTGYVAEPPAGVEIADGMAYNPYFPGWQIAMPELLFEDSVEYADGTAATVEQMAEDVTTFLAWAAEPSLERRHSLGFQVIIYLILLTGLFWLIKRRTWRDVH